METDQKTPEQRKTPSPECPEEKPLKPVSLYYDDLCSLHTFTHFEEFDSDYDEHPEQPARIVDAYDFITKKALASKLDIISNQRYFAKPKHLYAVHSKQYVDGLDNYNYMENKELFETAEKMDSIYLHRMTASAAKLAAGTVVKATKDLLLDEHRRASFCLTRPPGHHAFYDKPSGFCFLNNAVIAAKYAIEVQNYKRVLIFDWDIHHGNGTQALTYDDNHILFISLHRDENGGYYPASDLQSMQRHGADKAKGLNINVPFSRVPDVQGATCGDPEFLYATELLLPIIKKFVPDLVIISAGFDAARGDPLGRYEVTPEQGFPGMLHRILSVVPDFTKMLLVLEGGYNLKSVSQSTYRCLEFLHRYHTGESGSPNSPKRYTKHSYTPTSIQSVKEFALHNLEAVLKSQIPIWNHATNGKLKQKLEQIKTELESRNTQRMDAAIKQDIQDKNNNKLRRSPRKNQVVKKMSEDEKRSEPDLICDLSQSFAEAKIGQ